MLSARTELRHLEGLGPRRAASLAAHGARTIEDLLYHLPFRYEDRRSFGGVAALRPGGPELTLAVRVEQARLIRTRRRGFTIFEAQLGDASGRLKAVWYNQSFLARVLVPGRRVVVYGGAVLDRSGRIVLENPDYEVLDDDDAEGIHTGRIVPVYRKLGECNSRALRRLVFRALAETDPASLPPIVGARLARQEGFPERLAALRETHFPPQDAALERLERRESAAQRYLVFEEIYLLQLALAVRRRALREQVRGITYEITDALRTRLAALLPFKLTAAQKRVLKEIGADLRSSHPMQRLLQGDVGSGKTVVALLALLVAVDNGYQGALMAPTEILAEQHERNIARWLAEGGLDCRVRLLTGSLRTAERRRVLEEIRTGAAQLVVGTHALFEPDVVFHKLGLAVVDEQHRFGVLQRAALAGKGPRPDVLVMTATPIPRSLALTLYGDLELSVIDELPPGRTPVTTVVRGEEDRARVYARLRLELAKGRQAYFVVPLVEQGARSELKAATAFAGQLRRDGFAEFRVETIHGRMKGEQKDETMRRFAAREIDVLVATTVIEVGVDVPNATVMVVEHAERFGLSQLHQLRGRVGRGTARSWCVLMVGDPETGREARERLRIMERTADGFRIAQRDLELRGPGAVFGTQQHGLSDLQFLAEILRTPDLIERAREEARALVAGGDDRGRGALAILGALGERWKRRLELADVG